MTERSVDAQWSRQAAEKRAYAAVIDGLAELDRLDCRALRLIYWSGRTHAQVAVELDVPVATIHLAVARGMRRLAGRLTGPRPAAAG